VHRRDAHAAALVHELTAQRIGEPARGVLGGAVAGLQWDAAVGERRADHDDHPAVARAHTLQRGKGSVDLPEVRDLEHAAVVLGRGLVDERERRGHRVVDPDVDRTQLRLYPRRRLVNRRRVADVQRAGDRARPGGLGLGAGRLEALGVARDEREAVAAAGERARPTPALAPVMTTTLMPPRPAAARRGRDRAAGRWPST